MGKGPQAAGWKEAKDVVIFVETPVWTGVSATHGKDQNP